MRHTLTFFIVLLLAPYAALQAADALSKQNTDNPFMLTANCLRRARRFAVGHCQSLPAASPWSAC